MALSSSSYQYTEILPENGGLEKFKAVSTSHPGTQSLQRKFYIIVISTIVIIFTAIVSFALGQLTPYMLSSSEPNSQTPSHPPRKHCGNSSAEALSLNCTFDPLTVTWLPADCPRDMTAEFMAYDSWTYTYDEAGKDFVPDYEELSHLPRGELYWATLKEHMVHCAFIFIRKERVSRRGGRIDGLASNTKHGEHYARLLMDNMGVPDGKPGEVGTLGERTVAGDVGFLSC